MQSRSAKVQHFQLVQLNVAKKGNLRNVFFLLKNYCGHAPCRNNGTCQSGFTIKRYRCLCLPGYDGEHCENGK